MIPYWEGREHKECASCGWVGTPEELCSILPNCDYVPDVCPECGKCNDFVDPEAEEREKLKEEGYSND